MRLSIAMAAAAALGFSATAVAEEGYPKRPIRIIIPYQAGGGTDVMTRIIVEKVRERLKQPFVIDTKPGANTIIGTKALLAAPPDGYTLMMTTSVTFTTAPFVNKNIGYDPFDSFSLINYVAYTPVVFVVNSSVKANTLDEFVKMAKAQPMKFSLGTYGTQLSTEVFQKSAGFKLNSIPYKGVDAVNAVVGGQVDSMFDGVFTALPYIKQGKTKALALMQDQRTRFAPDIPTAKELGYKVTDIPIWYALVGPKGMDPRIVAKLSEEFRIAMKSPEVIEALQKYSRPDQIMLDITKLGQPEVFKGTYQGVCW